MPSRSTLSGRALTFQSAFLSHANAPIAPQMLVALDTNMAHGNILMRFEYRSAPLEGTYKGFHYTAPQLVYTAEVKIKPGALGPQVIPIRVDSRASAPVPVFDISDFLPSRETAGGLLTAAILTTVILRAAPLLVLAPAAPVVAVAAVLLIVMTTPGMAQTSLPSPR